MVSSSRVSYRTTAAVITLLVPLLAFAETDSLLSQFQTPPDDARPRVWWHWMNGNVTWDGAKKDMDWMKRVGIAGLQSFDAGMATPRVVEERLPYMSAGWKAVFGKTAAYADTLGLELAVAGSPGWSETGGPWVKPEDAMKKMAWSVTRVKGGRLFSGQLAQPPTTTGVFQTSTGGGILGGREHGENPPEYYVDQKVIAFRAPADAVLPAPQVTASGGTLDAAKLADGDLEHSAIDLPSAAETGGISWIQFDYGRQVTIRGLTLSTIAAAYYDGLEPSPRNGTSPTFLRLEASNDGVTWSNTRAKLQTGAPQRTASVDPVKARYFRFVSVRPEPLPPRVLERFDRPQSPPAQSLPIYELVLRGEATIHSFEEKAAFYNNTSYNALPSGSADESAAVTAGAVLDLTSLMQADGKLNWAPPAGHWIVLRMGYSLTGALNRPASPEATGFEVDKLNGDAVKRYMEHYLGMYRDAAGGLIGKRGLHAIMFDSWEASNSNWTPLILEDFKKLRGYDATPWLPTLAGYVIDSPERSDAFLWDWRRTLQQLLKVNHYELLTTMLHDLGMIRYGEAHEELLVAVGDGMEMKQSADIPMGAMWQVNKPGDIEPKYFNDLQESASVAHIYGQKVVAAEALTGGPPFGSAPFDLKPTADAILLAGANRFVIHTSTHQPVDKGPGMTLGVGQYFTRNETWAEQARPWVDYLSRASQLLQQGSAVSDVAVFYGEDGAVIAHYRGDYPAVPDGYRYDYVNTDVLLNKLSVREGLLTTETGMRYGALFFARGTQRVSLAALNTVRALVEAGAILIGERPLGSPSLADDPAQVKETLDVLWPGSPVATVGKGRVFASAESSAALRAIGLEPDFTYAKAQPDSHVMFIHRRLADGDAYFLSNRVNRAEVVEASFRVSGRAPELWDPASGLTKAASYRNDGERTRVTVPLDRFGSVFVVFRQPATQPRVTVSELALQTVLELTGPWSIAFQSDRGAPANATFSQLTDFRDSADAGIRYFSGIAAYTKEVSLDRKTIAGDRLWLDLGDVRDLAEVWVNGTLAGTVWKPPYRVDITSAAIPGKNRIEIRSVNLWVNRLIGDVQPGVSRKITFTAADGKVPTDNPDSSARMSRQLRMPYSAGAPLRPSGLFGPVRIQREPAIPIR
jgi:hypothetical protein